MSALVVQACGPAVSVQDRGRYGWQRFGVSPAGAMDPFFLAAANLLAGAPAEAAAVEIGPGLARFKADGALTVALAGPDARLEVGGQVVPAFTAAHLADGDVATVRSGPGGVYAYLAVAGGIATAPDMGSRSQHRRSGIGGAPLAPGMRLPAGDGERPLMRFTEAPRHEDGPIRLLPGPQNDYFSAEMLGQLCGPGYRISAQADRMGLRLDGPALDHKSGYNIVSDGIVEGSIQVPGDGMPIILLRDRQTTGGYPKIATIISADLGRFAQIPSGTPVRFAVVDMDEAIAAARRMQDAIAALADGLVPAGAALTSERLLSLNLVGGVVSAAQPEPEPQAAS